ncbi:MAG: homocysteine S-methyltransferase family protein [Lachnospiraceae bacterium]|nr:homocysteine S-methyltransferase family protein [Lachnospiraceae bacterium]
MKKEDFLKMASERPVVLDGAMGTNLFLRGMPRRVCAEKWISDNPDVVIRLQKEYTEAGSNIIYAPTFGANRTRLKEYGLADETGELNRKLVEISRKAAEGKAMVAGDLSPTGLMLESAGGEAEPEEVFEVYREQTEALEAAGVDLYVIETMMSEEEILIGLKAILSVTDLPVMCTMTVDENGRGLFGGSIFHAAKELEAAGASAVGINCCSGPDKLKEVIAKIAGNVTIPVIAKPNAGKPVMDQHGIAQYDMSPELFCVHMKTLREAGAGILGGCCGTTPEYIRQLSEMLAKL